MRGPLAVIVGDVINDVVVRPLAPPVPDSDTASQVTVTRGGSGANQAAWMAVLGTRVRFAGRAGVADASDHRSALEHLGVEARIGVDVDNPTGTIVVLVGAGARSMYTDRGASAYLDGRDLGPDLLDGASVLHVSGYPLLSPSSRDPVLRLWADAVGAGLEVTVDPGSVAGLEAVGRGAFLGWTKGAAIAFPNLDEGRFLAGAGPEVEAGKVADRLLDHYGVVVLTLGSDGALVKTRGGDALMRPALPANVVDPTGAGDAFCAGYLAAHLAGGGPAEGVEQGLAASARAVATVGGRPPGPIGQYV